MGVKVNAKNFDPIQKFRSLKCSILKLLIQYDVDNISFSMMKKLKKFYDVHPDENKLASKSKAAAELFKLMKAIYDKRILLEAYNRTNQRNNPVTNQ